MIIEVSYKSRKYFREIPSSFRDFTRIHLLAFTEASYLHLQPEMVALSLILKFINLPSHIFFSFKKYHLAEILSELKYLSESEMVFENWLIPRIRLFRLWPDQIGPSGSLEDIEVLQLADALNSHVQFHDTKDIKHLHVLTAILFQSVSPIRRLLFRCNVVSTLKRPYNRETNDRRAKYFKNLSPALLTAIHYNFLGILKSFEEFFPNIPQTDKANPYGWIGLIYELSGAKLGTTEEVEKMNAFKTLLILDKIESDNKRIK